MTLRLTRSLLALALAGAMAACSPTSASDAAQATGSAEVATDKAAQLDRLYAQYWEEMLKLNPLAATFQGDPRYNDQLPNFLSEEYRDRSHDFTAGWLEKIEAVGSEGLEGQDLLSYQIFVRNAKDELASEQFPSWMQPVNQFYNIASTVVQLGSGTGAQPFKTVEDYDNWSKRASQVPVLFDQAIANMKQGVEAGVVQPRALMEKVLPQLDALIKDDAADTLFWKPIADMPESFSAEEKERITADYRALIEQQLMPAYRELREYIATGYMPHTRDTAGMAALPNGEAWYAFRARNSTTTDLTPAQIHQIGLDEVERIHGEIRKVMAEVGFEGSLQDFFAFMQTDPRFSFESEDALLAHYRGLEDKVNRKIPELFSLTPRAPFEIRPVEPFRAQSAAGGSYMRPSEDGSRPGIFYVNTYDLPTRKTWDAEDLFLHEAIPGHHFQLALQQELTGLPTFRRFGGETAFTEGWGLYAESLGKDLGVYTDPYSYFGYLQNELWRAIRLVVDTGLHSKGWTREQVIEYMLENSAESETQATAEAERYMAIPGQALAYKIGELKIQEMRDKAEAALGEDFDVRAFHAEVLKDGSVPLDVLEDKINRWIESEKA
ncbi:hypothetical protein N799_05705 [Lysobacter arseniciresistens ZS79]|uniref:Lipoprotein n=1 Tax=Lysobacter arseniciresistens ZS79 TaxID=913325 RepID=A0A0A0F327_9GAMM|nr:DUF885 family protein [Lysobacter arseniciresistens]KGM57551.1 hypothetical protein N799_05705 [Lysobacter arseniciresistens ZS79]